MIERRWASSSAAGDRGGLLGLEGERVGPDADLGAGLEDGRLAAQHLLVAHHATVQPHVLQVAAGRRATRTTAWRRETSGLCSTTLLAGSRPMVISGVVHLDHRAAALVDLVVPDLHGKTCSMTVGSVCGCAEYSPLPLGEGPGVRVFPASQNTQVPRPRTTLTLTLSRRERGPIRSRFSFSRRVSPSRDASFTLVPRRAGATDNPAAANRSPPTAATTRRPAT